jgi:hypothetical protein
MVTILLAAALLAQPADPTPDPEPPLAAAVRPLPPEDPQKVLQGWRHGLGLGYQGTTFWSREGSHYTFHSAALSWLASHDRTGPMLHLSALLPLQAQQDGRVFAASAVYGSPWGADLVVGRQWRWKPTPRTEAEIGPGIHAMLLWLPGRAGYRDFSALHLGVAGESVLRWRPGARVAGAPISIGGFGGLSWDVYDPMRSNDLRTGFTFRVGLFAGFGGG